VIACVALTATPAGAQIHIRGFGDIGVERLAAPDSFNAITGSGSAKTLGGGVEASLSRGLFASVRASRIHASGQRVFLFQGEQFNLGIPTTIVVQPLELTAGYRFESNTRPTIPLGVRSRSRFIPYAGAGVGWYHFEESSALAHPDENVSGLFVGFHVVGGAIFPLWQWLGLGAEAQWATVPNALGKEPNTVSHEFNETDLGGVTLRLKIVVGR
jgi:hypothetical protein